jgi:hypothetical protein
VDNAVPPVSTLATKGKITVGTSIEGCAILDQAIDGGGTAFDDGADHGFVAQITTTRKCVLYVLLKGVVSAEHSSHAATGP